MSKLKILTVVGTRPEVIRLSRVLFKLDSECDHKLVHTGQNYDHALNEIFFDDLGIRKPDYILESAKNSNSSIDTIANILKKVDQIIDEFMPDAFLILGDTNSCLSAISAKKRKIPIFHMEAGNRCFDFRVPEEINRKIVDHIADVNLTYSDIARQYLIKEGLSPDLIIKTGSPMPEVLNFYKDKIGNSEILKSMHLKKHEYFLVSMHREENLENQRGLQGFLLTLNALSETTKMPIVISTHPRTHKHISFSGINLNKQVILAQPFAFTDYINLQENSKAVLSDSGTISEESSILNFPALNIRESHERPEAMEETAVIMVGFNNERILQGLALLEKQSRGVNRTLNLVTDYNSLNISEKILRIIYSYTDYVNRVIWKKY